jgi:hypothetical protein
VKKLIVSSLIAVISMISAPESSQALSIQGASSVTTNLGTSFGSITPIINQAGLLNPYTNGENLEAYLLTNPKHTPIYPGFEWFSDRNRVQGNIDFDLGSLFSLASVVIWNEEFQGINQFRIVTAGQSDFSDSVNQGLFNAVNNPNGSVTNTYSAEQFTFTTTLARYVRLQPLSAYNDGNNNNVALGEVAFGVNTGLVDDDPSAVPFEFSPALGLGVLGCAWLRHKASKNKLTKV